jgi:hypothetical protein
MIEKFSPMFLQSIYNRSRVSIKTSGASEGSRKERTKVIPPLTVIRFLFLVAHSYPSKQSDFNVDMLEAALPVNVLFFSASTTAENSTRPIPPDTYEFTHAD